MAHLQSLPDELLDQIITDPALSRYDLRSLRLASRRIELLSTQALFSRICISRLWRDRNSFLSVAATPYLAKHVQTLSWYEFAANLDRLVPLLEDDEQLHHDLLEQAKDSFWLQVTCNEHVGLGSLEVQQAAQKAAVDSFLPLFLEALSRFPHLSTLVSEPMCLRNPLHRIQPTADGHSLLAIKFFDYQLWQDECNIGAKLFLPNAMEYLDASSTHKITSLRYTDEVWKSCFYNLPTALFGKNLTSVDLAFRHLDPRGHKRSPESVGPHLSKLLASCEDLAYVRFDFSRSEMAGWACPFGLMDFMPFLPRLYELHLHGIPLDGEELGPYLVKHAATLRHVYIELSKCAEWEGDSLDESLSVLQLETFVLETSHFEEDEVPQTPTYDSPKPFRRRYTLDCPELTMDEYPDPPSLVWPRRTLPSDPVFHASSLEGRDLGPGPIEDQEADIMADITSGGLVCPGEEDERPLYAREHISHLKHHTSQSSNEEKHPPEWFFAKHSDGTLYYRQAHPVLEKGWATEVWRFKHRNGEEAMGDEPLEFWSDWEGSEAGDMEEATPYGKVFSHCFHDWDAGTGWEEEAARRRELSNANLDGSADLVLREAPVPPDIEKSVPEPAWLDGHEVFWEPLCRWNAVRWYTKTTKGSEKPPDADYTDY